MDSSGLRKQDKLLVVTLVKSILQDAILSSGLWPMNSLMQLLVKIPNHSVPDSYMNKTLRSSYGNQVR